MSAYSSTRPYLIRALHEWMGDNALTPHIVVDATAPGVRVPAHAVRDGQIILNISTQATHRLELGNEVLRFAARFGGREQWLEVPVDAVMAIFARESGAGMSFQDRDGPTDTAPAADGPPTDQDPSGGDDPGAGPPPRGRPRLKVVK